MKNVSTTAAAVTLAFVCAGHSPALHAEGSRNLYPPDYDTLGPRAARANLDLQPTQQYLERVRRRGFNYVYVEAGEYLLLGSSNIGNGGDVRVFNPQDFGARGDETLPASADFSCVLGTAVPGDHYAGGGRGAIASRAAELAGPNAADGSATVPDGFAPCAYQAPETGIYGVQFTVASGGGGPRGSVTNVGPSSNSVAAWDVTVRSGPGVLENIDGRLFTYAFIGFTNGNTRPLYSTHWYATEDGYRYRQDLRGLDPNGYALYANTFGFFDDGQPLYRDLRGTNAQISNLLPGLSTQPAEYPIFFSDIAPGSLAAPEAEKVLTALGIPLEPPSPQISDVAFEGVIGAGVTTTGVGGTFSFRTTDTVSYQIVISRDGDDFDPANPLNRLLTGIAFTGVHEVPWDGRDNDGVPFPARETPYPYRAFGRNGEVHFPIIDAENNGNRALSPPIPGGGPTIIRLNGTDPGDTTVFFDDRGYVTRRGESVGTLNGTLCPNPTPAAPSPAVDLNGVDSRTDYRLWQAGANRNRDCAGGAGWGDAKALNLWTYFLTESVDAEVEIRETVVDLGTTVSVTDSIAPGESVQGVFSFSNNGANPATGVTWSMQLEPGLVGVFFDNLPPGVSAVYDPATGQVTFPGAPTTMAPGDDFPGLIFRYTAPDSGPVTVSTRIGTSDDDQVPENDSATAVTAIGEVDVATSIDGLPALVEAGETVSGTVTFTNQGNQDAEGVTYALSIGEPGNVPTDVQFSNLPPGVSVSFDPTTGVATLSGLPATLTVGDVLALSFSYTAPATGAGDVVVRSSITTTSDDANPDNDSDAGNTAFFFIEVTAAGLCENDAPYLDYEVTAVGFAPTAGVTVTLVDDLDQVVATLADQPLTGRLLWPEAAVDANGRGEAWPGWSLQNGAWVAVPTNVRPGLTVRFEVNPDAEQAVSYPPSTGDCFTDPPADLLSEITLDGPEAAPGQPVAATVRFANVGGTPAAEVSYSLTVGAPGTGPDSVGFTNLPPGVTADYDPATGIVTFTGLPDQLAPGEEVVLDFTFTAPIDEGATLPLGSDIGTSTRETDTDNNPDDISLSLGFGADARLDVTAAAVCVNDAPYLDYTIEAVNFSPNTLATLEFIGQNGRVVERLADLPLEGGRVLWPEAAVDGNGRGIAWPGFERRNGIWREVPSQVRPEVTVRFTVNPTVERRFTYPPATPDCATGPRYTTEAVPLDRPWLALMAGLLLLAGMLAQRQRVRR